jgi:hypothetical protein
MNQTPLSLKQHKLKGKKQHDLSGQEQIDELLELKLKSRY